MDPRVQGELTAPQQLPVIQLTHHLSRPVYPLPPRYMLEVCVRMRAGPTSFGRWVDVLLYNSVWCVVYCAVLCHSCGCAVVPWMFTHIGLCTVHQAGRYPAPGCPSCSLCISCGEPPVVSRSGSRQLAGSCWLPALWVLRLVCCSSRYSPAKAIHLWLNKHLNCGQPANPCTLGANPDCFQRRPPGPVLHGGRCQSWAATGPTQACPGAGGRQPPPPGL